MKVRCFAGGGFGENAYLLYDPSSGDALAIDPGAGTPDLLRFLEGEGLTLRGILLTHAHLDHVEGVAALRNATGAPVSLHPDAEPQYGAATAQAAAFGVRITPPPPPDRWFRGGDRVEEGTLVLDVRDAPGHAPGHVLLVQPASGFAFVGDVIFAGSIGRTDLPGGDFRTLMDSIRGAVLTLPDDMRLFPGHGPETTVGHERRHNPFLTPLMGGQLA